MKTLHNLLPEDREITRITDDRLYDLLGVARDPVILGIRSYLTKKGAYSPKQRKLLERWVIENTRWR